MDIYKLIDQVLDETELTDLHEIVDAVMARIPADRLADVLRKALVDVARQQISRHNVGGTPAVGVPASVRAGARSWKVAGVRDEVAEAWRRALRDRIAVADGQRKMLADCTYADLLVAANERFAQAAANTAKAEWFTRLAKAVKRYDADTLGALPEDVLREVITS